MASEIDEEEEKRRLDEELRKFRKEKIRQDIRTVDQLSKWKKMAVRGENFKVKIMEKGMHPTITIADVIEVKPVQVIDLKIGDVIFYRQGDNFVARRITGLGFEKEGDFIARGDALKEDEPPVQGIHILGKVIAVERGSERIPLERSLKRGGRAIPGIDTKTVVTKASPLIFKFLDLIGKGYEKACEIMDGWIEKLIKRGSRR